MWKSRLWRFASPFFIMVLLCGIQTVLWPNITTHLTAPPLWLILLTWIALYRDQRETILLIYLLGWLATAFTAMPLKMMLFSLLILFVLIRQVKERVFWPGTPYFVLIGTLSVVAFQVIYITLSYFLEPTPVAWLPLERLTIVLWAAPSALLIHTLMSRIEVSAPAERGQIEGGYV